MTGNAGRPNNSNPPAIFSPGQASDPKYCNLLSPSNDYAKAARRLVEDLWSRFFTYADNNFLKEIRTHFDARFWEMYLTCTILERSVTGGFKVCAPKPGPDIRIETDQGKIWIEAIVATNGDPTKPDSLIAPTPGRVYTVPEEKIILRYTNAISKKFNKYKEKYAGKSVGENDPFVIAINAAPLAFPLSDPEVPRILKAVFPIGSLECAINPKTGNIIRTQHGFRPAILKQNEEVSTAIFADGHHSAISAIIHSFASPTFDSRLGRDFILIHNPYASSPLPKGLLPAAREYSVDDDGSLVYEERA